MIKINSLSKSFSKLEVFSDFSLEIHKEEVLCLLGPSGCGKSTLLKILAGLLPYSGQISGLDINVSYVFQEARLLPWLTVYENLVYVLDGHVDNLEKHITDNLEKVDLLDFKDAFPNQLSGGMKQRVSLARAFAMPHELLLLDEPFQGLDDALKDQLMTLLETLIKQDSKTVIMVTHGINEAKRLGNRIVKLKGKPINSFEEVTDEN